MCTSTKTEILLKMSET